MIFMTPNSVSSLSVFFFFNDTATTEIYTLSLHDALPIFSSMRRPVRARKCRRSCPASTRGKKSLPRTKTKPPESRQNPRKEAANSVELSSRSEEHTSELQSHLNLVCRLLLEKKKQKQTHNRFCSATRIGSLAEEMKQSTGHSRLDP